MNRTLLKYQKATVREVHTVNTHGCGIVRDYSVFIGKEEIGNGDLKSCRALKDELNASHSKRWFLNNHLRSKVG